uniref:Uncharacterized protein n=1 Tax=Timema tahoe TaxID=61484 RepID=A0A7R9FIU8_9NEOP|nr:unnamed protein product [Timema tahoe]
MMALYPPCNDTVTSVCQPKLLLDHDGSIPPSNDTITSVCQPKLLLEHDGSISSSNGTVTGVAGVVLSLPSRVVAAVVTANYKLDYTSKTVNLDLDGGVWLDKERKPSSKTGLKVIYLGSAANTGVTAQGEARLTHPAFGKDFFIKGNVAVLKSSTQLLDASWEIDLFSKNKQVSVTATVTRADIRSGHRVDAEIAVNSVGQNLAILLKNHGEITSQSLDVASFLHYKDVKNVPRQVGSSLTFNSRTLNFKLKGPSSELASIVTEFKQEKGTTKSTTVFTALGVEPHVVKADYKYPPVLFVEFYKQKEPSKKLEAVLAGDVFSEVGVRADLVHGSEKKELVKVLIALTEDKFLKTTFSWSSENIQHLVEQWQKDVSTVLKQLTSILIQLGKEGQTELTDLITTLRKAQPNLKPYLQSYQQELKAIKDEVVNDKALKELSAFFNELFGGVLKGIAEASEKVTELANLVYDRFEKLEDAVLESWQKLLPTLEKSYSQLVDIAEGILGEFIDVAVAILQTVLEQIKTHEGDLKKLAQAFADILEEVGRVVGKTFVQLRSEVKDFLDLLYDQFKTLPVTDFIKEKYNELLRQLTELEIPVELWSVITEVISAVKDTVPTPELRDLVEAIESYVNKHLNKQKVDDVEELKNILSKATLALRSLVQMIKLQIKGEVEGDVPSLLGFKLPVSLEELFKIPRFFVAHFSPLAYLSSGDLPTLKELLVTYRPRLNPLDWVPPYKGSYTDRIQSQTCLGFEHRSLSRFPGVICQERHQQFIGEDKQWSSLLYRQSDYHTV